MEQYESLAAAIIEQALLDYRRAQKHIQKKFDVEFSWQTIKEIENFLKSSWFDVLCDLDGEKLLEKMKGES